MLSKTTKPLSAILPRRRHSHSVANVADFTAPLALNTDFSQLAENKPILTKQAGTISFFEMQQMESSTHSFEAQGVLPQTCLASVVRCSKTPPPGDFWFQLLTVRPGSLREGV